MRQWLRHATVGALVFAALPSCQMLAGLGERHTGNGGRAGSGPGGAAATDGAEGERGVSGRAEATDRRPYEQQQASSGRAPEPVAGEAGSPNERNEGGAAARTEGRNATSGTAPRPSRRSSASSLGPSTSMGAASTVATPIHSDTSRHWSSSTYSSPRPKP